MIVDADEATRRIIEPDRFVADPSAFIDVRLPQSIGKRSYSFIGPGVSQNSDQTVNLTEPHGFNIGAASMPPGVVNNPHMHYTAEVFICTGGRWEMRLGHGDDVQTLEIGPGTVFSVPTWVFRGFTNIGDDDGWLFTILGGDDTGGILWAPEVLRAAAETGLHLAPDHSVIDRAGNVAAADGEVLAPVGEERLAELDRYSAAEIRECVVEPDDLDWSQEALLAAATDRHATAVAPVIGFGISEHRRHQAPILTRHGFSADWLTIGPGSSIGRHRLDEPQVLLLGEGSWEIVYNRQDDEVRRPAAPGSVVSIPAGAWRDVVNTGETEATALVVCNGDQPARFDWDPQLVAAAADAGFARDAGGYLAPTDLLGRPPAEPEIANDREVNKGEVTP